MVWFRDEAVVARMQELIQAYRTDPTAAETLQELAGLRRVLTQLWLDVEPVQLQTLDQTAVGAVTRALILSGFGSELTDDADVAARQQLSSLGADFSSPAAPAALLGTLLFYPLKAVSFETTDGLPAWFVDLLHELAAESVDG